MVKRGVWDAESGRSVLPILTDNKTKSGSVAELVEGSGLLIQ